MRTSSETTRWSGLLRFETAQVWKSGAVRIWILLLVAVLAFAAYKVDAAVVAPDTTGSSTREELSGLMFFLTMGASLTLLIPIGFFIPVVSAGFARKLIKPSHVHFFLSRPFSRTQLAGLNVAGVVLGYGVIITGFVGLAWLLFATKGTITPALLLFGPIASVAVGGIYALLLTLLLATRSSALAMVGTLLYTLFLTNILKLEITGAAWWKQAGDVLRESLQWILPPVGQLSDVLTALLTTGVSAVPLQAVVSAVLSLVLFGALSSWLYHRMEF